MADDQFVYPDVEPPLAVFEGREPPAPEWFNLALAQEPERSFTEAQGAKIEYLAWGERGKPGILLVHGSSAHADWWSFTAPFLADGYRVAALSLSGMGASDWREQYSFDIFAHEMCAVAEAAGLYDSGEPPVFIGHSFGGSQVFYAARSYPEWMRAAILLDTGFGRPPPAPGDGSGHPMTRNAPNKVYPTVAAALARFRFMPQQTCDNPFIADFIARKSLKAAPLVDGGQGWTWRFDPSLLSKLDRSGAQKITQDTCRTPLFHIYGARSKVIERVRRADPDGLLHSLPSLTIPDAEHHIMVDQPLALVTAIQGVLVGWPKTGG